MADFIVSPASISFDSILGALQDWVNSKADSETWQDFYASAAGETVLEIAAALGAFYAYQFIMGRRESYLSTAINYSSILGLAENLGYSASRGTNLCLTVNIVPSETVTLSKWTIIGSYTEYDVVLLEDTILNEGVSTDINVIIGDLSFESINITTNQLTQFTFSNSLVTDTYKLLLNDTEVPVSTSIADAINDYYITLSNSLGSVDVFYLNTGEYQYSSGDTLYLYFIERNSVTSTSFSKSNLVIDYATQINEYSIYSEKTDVESSSSIKTKAPIYHETSSVIRSRKDYSKYILTQNSSLIAANDRDITPGLIEITYLKEDYSIMTDEEKEYWLEQIEEARPSGVAKAIITDPVAINLTLSISLWKSNTTNISSTISNDIDEILQTYTSTFEAAIDLNQIEHDIEQLTGIKIARVEFNYVEWEASTYYDLYSQIETSDGTYYVSSYLYFTGNSEPNWDVEIDETVIDGDIVWTRVNAYSGTVLNQWEANTETEKYDFIYATVNDTTYIFMCTNYVNKTGSTEPNWGNNTVYDGDIIWQISSLETENQWEANNTTYIGDLILASNLVYRCSGYRKTSGTSTPAWAENDNGAVIDNNIKWLLLDTSARSVTLHWNEYLILSKTYSIVG